MIHSVSDTITLHTGNSVPGYGFGTGGLRDDTLHAVRDALADGYRSIDSGQRYGNERDIGLAVAQSGISRKDITLSTKWCAPFQVDYGALEIPSVQEIVETLKESVVRLNNGRGVDHGGYIDLVLLHHAGPNREWRERGWKALSEAWEAGWVRDIGVSNFGIKQLESLSAPKPAICQLELNPWIQQKEVVKYCQERGIVVQIGTTSLVDIYCLDGVYRKGSFPFLDHRRRKEYRLIKISFDFELTNEEMMALDGLDQGAQGRQTLVDSDNLPE